MPWEIPSVTTATSPHCISVAAWHRLVGTQGPHIIRLLHYKNKKVLRKFDISVSTEDILVLNQAAAVALTGKAKDTNWQPQLIQNYRLQCKADVPLVAAAKMELVPWAYVLTVVSTHKAVELERISQHCLKRSYYACLNGAWEIMTACLPRSTEGSWCARLILGQSMDTPCNVATEGRCLPLRVFRPTRDATTRSDSTSPDGGITRSATRTCAVIAKKALLHGVILTAQGLITILGETRSTGTSEATIDTGSPEPCRPARSQASASTTPSNKPMSLVSVPSTSTAQQTILKNEPTWTDPYYSTDPSCGEQDEGATYYTTQKRHEEKPAAEEEKEKPSNPFERLPMPEAQPRPLGPWEYKAGGIFRTSEGGGSPRAALVLPLFSTPVVYANTNENVMKAKKARIDDKQIPFTGDAKDLEHIGTFIRAVRAEVFSDDVIRAAVIECMPFLDLKSSKWSEARAQQAIDALHQKLRPTFAHAAIVKAEPMQEGKAPRLLISDGDQGQIMALLVLSVFEHILFSSQKIRSIKGRPVNQAMKDIASHVRIKAKAATTIEGDGSAWDTCCNATIRSKTENVILENITKILKEFVSPQSWHQAHQEACAAKRLRLKLPEKKDSCCVFAGIDAIRRSGHRGTSSLNWFLNWTLWSVSLFGKHAKEIISTETGYAKDRWDKWRNVRMAFEGDDSILVTFPKPTPSQKICIEEFWKRMGYNMKLKFIEGDSQAEFCGHIFATDSRGLTNTFGRDVPRALKNGALACPPNPRAFFENPSALRELARSKSTSYAATFLNMPTLLRQYVKFAKSLGGLALDEEGIRKSCGGNKATDKQVSELLQEIMRVAESPNDLVEEAALYTRLGWPTTPEELVQFSQRDWDYSHLLDHGIHLPESWKSK